MTDANTLLGRLQAWADGSPTAIALRHKVLDVWVARTWRELRDEVGALAAGLASLGFSAGDRIWIATDVRPEPLLVALAAQWLGGSAIVADSTYQLREGVRATGRVDPESTRLRRSSAGFAFVQDGAVSRAWLDGDEALGSPVRLIYLDTRGALSGVADGTTYKSVLEQGRTLPAVPASAASADYAAIFVAGANIARYASAPLLAAATTTATRAALGSDHDASASGLALDQQLTLLLPLWLQSGARLNFAEDAATTSDADRRELGPSLIVSTPDELERLRQRVFESLPPAPNGSRNILAPTAKRTALAFLRTRIQSAIRDALGWTQTRTALVSGTLEQPAADFCASLGITVHALQAPIATAASESAAEQKSPARWTRPQVALPSVAELAPRTRESFLRLQHISLAFNEVKAINDISFGVARHEVCALIGPNGAGKSSLLNVINGIYRPNSGEIHFAGEVRSAMTPRSAAKAGIARTFQNLAIFKGMTVLENVIVGRNLSVTSSWIEQAFWIGRARANEDASRQRAEEVLEFLRLQRYRHVLAAQLPYGLQKRVELARAIVADPRLLLLDEPMAGMNADEKADMSEIILDINRELGTTVVLIEHDMRVVMDVSDHVVVLDYGRLVGDGTPAEVRQNPDVLRAYLGRKRVA